MTAEIPLAEAFPLFAADDWHAAVVKTRRSRSHREPEPDAIGLHPRRSDARPILGRQPGQPWRIVERVHGEDAAAAARAVRTAVTGGATGIEIVFNESLHPLKSTLPVAAADEVARALTAIIPERFLIRVDAGAATAQVAEAFLGRSRSRAGYLTFGHDPVAAAALGASALNNKPIAIAAEAMRARGIPGAVLLADGRLWHAGGATEEQELAATLATFVHHAQLLGDGDRIDIALSADSDQFRTIAKFRAMRLLLTRVVEVVGLSCRPHIHAETAWRSLSARDPHTNILRATSAAFGAASGGADSTTVLPFDAVGVTGDIDSTRLARNLQIILVEEASLARVADPAAGSGAIEAMTATFAETAWRRFQAIEAKGGILAAIAEGSLLRQVADARDARFAQLARNEIKLVGVNLGRGGVASIASVDRLPAERQRLTFERLSAQFEDAP